jgi:hypothetical protein
MPQPDRIEEVKVDRQVLRCCLSAAAPFACVPSKMKPKNIIADSGRVVVEGRGVAASQPGVTSAIAKARLAGGNNTLR